MTEVEIPKKSRINKWMIMWVVTFIALAVETGLLFSARGNRSEPFEPVKNDSVESYNRGYIQGVNDIFTEAYNNGIVKVPFNDTHNLALIPWQGVE